MTADKNKLTDQELADNMWNRWGEQDAAIKSWENADPNDIEVIFRNILNEEITKELNAEILAKILPTSK